MKILFTLLFLCIASNLYAQYFENFDGYSNPWLDSFVIHIDSNFHNNRWQIGQPHKTLFDSSDGNVIVTDTVNNYPPNDTSAFYFIMPQARKGQSINSLKFDQYVDIDSSDIAMVQISVDKGMNWQRITDTLHDRWGMVKNGNDSAIFSSTGQWEPISISVQYLWQIPCDTFFFRFILISSNDTIPREGWMIDNIYVEYFAEGVATIRNDKLFSIYPNPVSDILQATSDNKHTIDNNITIWRVDGAMVYNVQSNKESIDVSSWPNGIYFIKYANDKEFSVKRFIIDR